MVWWLWILGLKREGKKQRNNKRERERERERERIKYYYLSLELCYSAILKVELYCTTQFQKFLQFYLFTVPDAEGF